MVLITLLTIVASFLLLGLTILVHEFGHYLSARLCGMVVDVFSIGFGPAIWKTSHKGITYKIGAIPFGGYVALPQMEPPSAERRQADAETNNRAGHSESQLPPVATWKRIVVSLSGATGNVILALALAWLVYTIYTPDIPGGDGVMIGLVESGSAAEAAGLQPADRILAVNGERVSSWTAMMQVAALSDAPVLTVQTGSEPHRTVTLATQKATFDIKMIPGLSPGNHCRVQLVEADSPAARAGLRTGDLLLALDDIPLGGNIHLILLISERLNRQSRLTVQRGQETLEIVVVPELHPEHQRAMIGIHFDLSMVERPLAQLRNDALPVFRLLRALFRRGERREATRGVGGPVSVLTMLWLQVSAGLLSALTFTRFLNVNLAIINLLPIPVLDGGHIMFALFEMITRRRLHPRILHGMIHVFAVLLIGLMLLLTYRDIFSFGPRLWGRPDRTAEVLDQPADDIETANPNGESGNLPIAP